MAETQEVKFPFLRLHPDKYQKWTKIQLSEQQTGELYECLRGIVNKANEDIGLPGQIFPDLAPLLYIFPGGKFITYVDSLTYNTKGPDKKHLKRSVPDNRDKSRLNLSVIKVLGVTHYRLFISHRISSNHTVPILTTDINILQFSLSDNGDKEIVLKRDCPADKYMTRSHEGKIITYKEYFEKVQPRFWSFVEKKPMDEALKAKIDAMSQHYIDMNVMRNLNQLGHEYEDLLVKKELLSETDTSVAKCLSIFASDNISSVTDALIDHYTF